MLIIHLPGSAGRFRLVALENVFGYANYVDHDEQMITNSSRLSSFKD